MRSKLSQLLIVCGLIAAAMSPALACNLKVEAANDQAAAQHTAQAQSSTESNAN